MTIQQMFLAAGEEAVTPVVPFNLTLDGIYTSNPRLGDTTSEQSTWWGTQTYDAVFVSNIGQQSYQGFYAFTAGKNATLTATIIGASGWPGIRGRSITATFSIAVGDRIVFFAGKSGNTGTNTNEGGGGGASCLMKYGSSLSSDADYSNGFVPLIIAAGGGSGTFNGGNELGAAAPPLSTTVNNSSSAIMTVRNNHYPNANLVAKGGGAGRDDTTGGNGYQAHTGGNGWSSPSRHAATGNATDITLSGISYPAVGLSYGAKGNIKLDTVSGDGGFGGGGSDFGSNSYGAGGGGYYGGNECTGANSMLNNAYTAYTYVNSAGSLHQTEGDMRHGALSFVHSSGSSVTDNGLYPTSSIWPATILSGQQQGQCYLAFT